MFDYFKLSQERAAAFVLKISNSRFETIAVSFLNNNPNAVSLCPVIIFAI